MGLIGMAKPVIGNGGAPDVGTKVFDGGVSGTNGLDVDAPVGVPDDGINAPLALEYCFAEVVTKNRAQHGYWNEELFVFA